MNALYYKSKQFLSLCKAWPRVDCSKFLGWSDPVRTYKSRIVSFHVIHIEVTNTRLLHRKVKRAAKVNNIMTKKKNTKVFALFCSLLLQVLNEFHHHRVYIWNEIAWLFLLKNVNHFSLMPKFFFCLYWVKPSSKNYSHTMCWLKKILIDTFSKDKSSKLFNQLQHL